jgi:branched-chain amino acid transport system ATP-binding protein
MAILETKGLKRYFGGLEALNDVSIEVHEKEVLGLIGPNGAGKSTFINVIAGIYLPTEGSIIFDGRDISRMPAHKRCIIGIGRTFQIIRPLEDMNLLENIMVGGLFGQGLGKLQARKNAEEICEFVGLKDIQKGVSMLTALEIKKLAISQALATKPKILFLDEVMAGLNTDETMELIGLAKKINEQGIAIVVIEHVMRVIKELTQRVVVLDWGQLLAQGPYDTVSEDPEVISAYLGEDANA